MRRQGRRHLVQDHPARAAAVTPGDDFDRGRVLSGLQKNDGRGVNGTGTYPFTTDCHRIENGSPTTNVPNIEGPFAMDCMGQFKMGYYFVVQAIHGRRYPLVDAERGVVWAHCVFDQGTVNSGTLSDGRAYCYRGFNRPGSILVTEAFLIDGGKIRRVE